MSTIDLGEMGRKAITAIHTAISFYTFALFITGSLLGLSLFSQTLPEKIRIYGMIINAILFFLVVLIVSIIVCFKPGNLYFKNDINDEKQQKKP